MSTWPMRQFFFCIHAAEQGGETPLINCRDIYNKLDTDIRQQFETKGLLYTRNFIKGFDVSWQDFFKTDNKEEVAVFCQKHKIDFNWMDDETLKISRIAPAVAVHPQTRDKVFFNQIQLHHPYFLAPKLREFFTEHYDGEFPRNVFFGDGAEISDSVLAYITELYWQNSVKFTWRNGDVVLLDNMLTAHARNPFTGTRKVVVALSRMVSEDDVLA